MFFKAKKLSSLLIITSMLLAGCSSTNDVKTNSDINNNTITNIEQTKDDVSSAISENTNADTNTDTNTNVNTNVNVSNQKTETANIKITAINTGNSDAILIQDLVSNTNFLIDSGDNDDESFMVNRLKGLGIKKLDFLMASHFDADHIGGLDAVIDNFEIGRLIVPNGDADTKTYRDFIYSAGAKNVPPSVPLEGAKFNLGNAYFEVFNTDGGGDRNNDSLVVKLTNGNDIAVFMGDAGKSIENKIVNKIGDVDLIKVGHHGSHTSSDYNFIKSISPEFAIITCSKDNKYGHPHKETMDTLKSLNVIVHRNDECGDIIFTSNGDGFKTNCSNGSYNSGNKSSGSSSNSNNTGSSSNSNNYNSNNTGSSTTQKNEVVNTPVSTPNADVVYWVPNGEVYHSTSNCSSLSRSKVINSGSISESGKSRACKRC